MTDTMLRLIDFDFHNMTNRNRVLPSKHRPTAYLQTHRQRGEVIPVRHSFHGVCRFVCVFSAPRRRLFRLDLAMYFISFFFMFSGHCSESLDGIRFYGRVNGVV